MDDSMDVSAFEGPGNSSEFEMEPVPKAVCRVSIHSLRPTHTNANCPQKTKAFKAPAKKAAAASKPKATATKQTTLTKTTKAVPKAKAPPKTKKRPKADSDAENTDVDMDSLNDDSLLSNTPPSAKKQKKAPVARKPKAASKPLVELENESFAMDVDAEPGATAKKGGASDQYQKLTQLEHILKRPDTYIGSVESTTEQMWVFNSETQSMENRKVSFVPGLYKIFDEILVNAADNKQRDDKMNEMRVWVDAEKGVISVKNNGRGIPIEMHEKEGIYVPEMIFGHLLTSSNYDDDQAKTTGGRNGYGAKLANIYSTKFQLDTVDTKTKKRYRQTWKKNMSVMDKAVIEKNPAGTKDYTQITFMPDFAKFGMDRMDEELKTHICSVVLSTDPM
jgi:DNA topoisomerase-2